ncbi:PREDICTED: mpv17-like protein 2 isoform X2 [Dinoponera quadriceps]|uniref:Mpv17-like protein 2 isoform X2 n=1 Tax=Dinoponera quadriceps TaxID=609295 RepID=A0A6P3X3T5_DINQU|nr:PREDICTED: mpv17-like protein 2 isoform X2 [Dinoponera quadriceps]
MSFLRKLLFGKCVSLQSYSYKRFYHAVFFSCVSYDLIYLYICIYPGKYLFITNTVSCGLMMAAGDAIQQRNEHWRKHCSQKYFLSSVIAASLEEGEKTTAVSGDPVYGHDYMRTRNMAVVGLLQGPFHHWFYMFLDRVFPGKGARSVIKKTLLDQTIASPTCLTIFFVGLGVLERRRIEEICQELKTKFCATWKVDCCFWPPTQCINFLFVPLHYRVLYTNAMTMVYDIFLSYMKYDAHFE